MPHFDPRVQLPGIVTWLFPSAIWRFPEAGKKVFLSFDDGPIPEVTPWVLALLKKENIPATFFCVADNVRKHPEVFAMIRDNGQTVGNHTFNHLQGLKTPTTEFVRNVEKADALVQSDLFRPPHGFLKRKQYQVLRKQYQLIMWDVVSCDYDIRLSPERVFDNVKRFVRNGSIIVFHDSLKAEKNLRVALPKTIEWLKQQGYSFGSIPNQLNVRKNQFR
jgi:peptidoglycan/xylan/chitin deacetylase (PgdA/CDA1 family)